MVRVLITGSADGLGLEAARQLVQRGHTVYLHARTPSRANDARAACPGAAGVLVADLTSVAETRGLAEEANAIGEFDAVILNAGIMHGPFRAVQESGGIPALAVVNVIAPYILACQLRRPKRLVFISSMLHRQADTSVEDIFWLGRGEAKYSGYPAYCDSKFHVLLMANALATRFHGTSVVSVHPGWVATKLGGEQATDKLEDGVETYVMLAEGDYDQGLTGKYFDPKKKLGSPIAESEDAGLQEKVVKACEEVTGLKVPGSDA
ncbi:short chain dehydrogenase [Aspergillus aurantiobrunneus]